MSKDGDDRIALWLDDTRRAPHGWTHARTAEEAREILKTGKVEWASLDHDLGTCEECVEFGYIDVRKCPQDCKHGCHETGYDLVCWMEENDIWPATRPRTHSANPVGAARMNAVIDKKFPRK